MKWYKRNDYWVIGHNARSIDIGKDDFNIIIIWSIPNHV